MLGKKWCFFFIVLVLFPLRSIYPVIEDKMMSEDEKKWKNIPVFLVDQAGKNRFHFNSDVTFGLLFRSNPSTGFSWELKPGYKDKIIDYLGITENEPDKSDKKQFGNRETDKFVFRSLNPGEIELEFIYHRLWEKDKIPEKKVLITIVITDK